MNEKVPLVVIGVSLGGARALECLLRGLPAGFPAAVAIAFHRGKTSGDTLVEFLQRACALPVREVEDKEPLASGAIYLAPAEYHLLVEDGHFSLAGDPPVNHARPSIDVLFESAADLLSGESETVAAAFPKVKPKIERPKSVMLIGVILSGANEDGAAGLAAIKAAGGLTLVQDPATAESRAMPDAALAAVTPDAVLPLEQIANWLVQQVKA